MDLAALEQCLGSYDVDKVIPAEKTYGDFLLIKSTPTYFINGKMIVGYMALEQGLKNYRR